jgi:hypothetical protein
LVLRQHKQTTSYPPQLQSPIVSEFSRIWIGHTVLQSKKGASFCPKCFLKFNAVWISLQLGLFANPVYSSEGDYPDIVKTRVNKTSGSEKYYRSKLRKFTAEEIMNIKGKTCNVHTNAGKTGIPAHWVSERFRK